MLAPRPFLPPSSTHLQPAELHDDSVFTDTYAFAGNPHASYDVMPDVRHFVFLEGESTGDMIVVSNRDAVVRARMGTGGR